MAKVTYDDEAPAAAASAEGQQSFSERALDAIMNSKRQPAPPRVRYDDEPPGGTQTGSMIRGTLPVVGPLLEKGMTAIAAAPAAVLPGEGFGAMYNKMQRGQNQYERDNPGAAAAAGFAGSLVGTVPVARAFPKAFGGTAFGGQTAAGGALGGADAAVRSGGDPHEIAKGAAIGASGPVIGSVLAPLGQALAAGGRAIAERTPGFRGILAPKIVPPPNADVLAAAGNKYDTLSRGGVSYSRPHLDDLNNLIRQDLYSGSTSTARSGAQTRAILDDNFANLPPNPTTLHRTRMELQDVINTHGPSSPEGRSAMLAKQKIEHFLEAPPPNAVISGQIDARTVGTRLKEANADYRAGMVDKKMREHIDRGLIDAENQPIGFLAEGDRTRRAVASYRKDRNEAQFRTPQDEEALAGVNRAGSIGERALRIFSGATGSGRFTTPLTAGGAGLIASSAFFPPAAVAGTGIAGGLASSAASTAMTRRAVNDASGAILAQSPYAQSVMRHQVYQPQLSAAQPYTPWKTSIGPKAYRDEISRLLAQQAERSTVEP